MDKEKDALKLMLRLQKERIALYRLACRHGRTHPWVIRQSQRIDGIIVELQRLKVAL